MPVVAQVFGAAPGRVDLIPRQRLVAGQVGVEHVVGHRGAHALVAVVQRHAQPVRRHVRQGAVDGQGVEEQHVPELVVGGHPAVRVLVGVDAEAAGAEREVVVDHPADAVGARQHGQAAQVARTVADRMPAGVHVHAALEVDEVLVDGRGVLRELWEPDARDLVREREHGSVDDLAQDVQDLRPVPGAVEALQPVDLVVDVHVVEVAFRAAPVRVGDAVHGIRAGHQPAVAGDDPHHVAAQRRQPVGVEETAEEQVALVVHAPPQLSSVGQRVVGDTKLAKALDHGAEYATSPVRCRRAYRDPLGNTCTARPGTRAKCLVSPVTTSSSRDNAVAAMRRSEVGIGRPAALRFASISPKMRATARVMGMTGTAESSASTNSSRRARLDGVSARRHPWNSSAALITDTASRMSP